MNIQIPTLLLDEDRMHRNVCRMVDKVKHNNVQLRPHLKTPQSNAVAAQLRQYGIHKIAVSSLRMAKYYVADGWTDILVAFPLNVLEMNLVNELAQQIDLQLIVDNKEAIRQLDQQLNSHVDIYIEVDAGYGRSGTLATDLEKIEKLVSQIESSKNLQFRGFLCHAGHTYGERDQHAVQAIHDTHIEQLTTLKNEYLSDYPDLIVSYGDTPSCSILNDFSMFEEIRPGNFVFYDLTQVEIGSCRLEDVAVALLCPVVGVYPDRGEIVIYGGGVHFSKDRLTLKNGQTIYGQIVNWKGNHWTIPSSPSYVRSLSQEHGVITASEALLRQTKVGDVLAILPVHSCMTVDLMPYYRTMKGEELEIWDKI
ncbi:MAG: alanine racemase [Bacteroidota bacterium]